MEGKSSKRIIIFLSIFLVVAIGITVGAIYIKNNQKEIENKSIEESTNETQQIVPDNLGIKSFRDTFDYNDLEIINEKMTRGEEVTKTYEWGYVEKYYPVEIDYIQIKGLKDKDIENKINSEIKEMATNLIPENWKKLDEQFYRWIYCSANYSNILSVFSINNDGMFESLNYNLVTGEKLEFKNLFTNIANIKSIITQSTYKSLAENKYANYELGLDMEKTNYSQLENDIFKVLNVYNSGEIFNFRFTEKEIYLNIANETVEIPIEKYYKDIAIYNRYAGKDIYDETYTNNKDVFVVFSRDHNNYYYSLLKNENDNIYIDIKMYNVENSDESKVVEMYKKEIEKELQDCRLYLKNNTDKAIAYIGTVNVYEEKEKDTITLNTSIKRYECSKQYYKESFLDYLIYAGKSSFGGIGDSYYIADDIVENIKTIKEEYSEREYSLKENIYTESEYKYNERKKIVTTYDIETGDIISLEEKDF